MGLTELLKSLQLPEDITRRGFLQATSAAAVLGMMNQANAGNTARPYIILESPQGLILGDPNLCVNCQRCELVCTEFNEGKSDPKLARIKIGRNIPFGLPGNALAPAQQGIWGNGIVTQDTCRQCPHPVPCANACPQGAIRVDDKTGARFVDTDLCTGCKLCQNACPWGMMTFDEEEQKASKCHLCHGKPKCVKECPAQALRFVPWKDRTREILKAAPHGYLPEENRKQCAACHG
ncbi:MAG: 4Fe-4S dicluster domain-containing protein [Sutterellaceae bacterium]|nr:4Fe-4S dicluster domain-containing protein [Sutterellaceae bacterium]